MNISLASGIAICHPTSSLKLVMVVTPNICHFVKISEEDRFYFIYSFIDLLVQDNCGNVRNSEERCKHFQYS